MKAPKSCPFCGAEVEVLSDMHCTWGLVKHRDGCFFPSFLHHQIPEDDLEAWNTRYEETCSYVGDDVSGGCSECRGWLDPACAYCPACGARVEG